jgi:hypothetical protein
MNSRGCATIFAKTFASWKRISQNSVKAKFSIAPPRLAKVAGDDEITPLSRRGVRSFLVYADTRDTQAERLGEGLGHRGGVLRGLIQEPASELPRITIPRTPVNRDKKEGRVLRKGTRPLHRVD